MPSAIALRLSPWARDPPTCSHEATLTRPPVHLLTAHYRERSRSPSRRRIASLAARSSRARTRRSLDPPLEGRTGRLAIRRLPDLSHRALTRLLTIPDLPQGCMLCLSGDDARTPESRPCPPCIRANSTSWLSARTKWPDPQGCVGLQSMGGHAPGAPAPTRPARSGRFSTSDPDCHPSNGQSGIPPG